MCETMSGGIVDSDTCGSFDDKTPTCTGDKCFKTYDKKLVNQFDIYFIIPQHNLGLDRR